MTDAELINEINILEAKKASYEKVRDSIYFNGLSTTKSLQNLDTYISHCEKTITNIDSDSGYHYLSNFRTKLEEDLNTLKEYRDYAKDSNNKFIELYTTLETNISITNTQISNKKLEYNKGKSWHKQYWL